MSNQEAEMYSRAMEKYMRQVDELKEEVLRLESSLKIAKQALRFIRSNSDCRNESEHEQCSPVAEDALREILEAE